MSVHSRYTELLQKYLKGTILPDEQAELFRLTNEENVEDLLAGSINSDWNTGNLAETDMPAETAEKIALNILASEEDTNRLVIGTHRSRWFSRLAVAAIFLLVALGGVFVYFHSLKDADKTAFEAYIPKSSFKKINNTGQSVEVFLEDGSMVRLKPNSSLSYPEHFVTDKREVYLTGEAFFEVAKNPNKPFLVYYNNIVTRVLGTSFSIKTNQNTNNVEVSVRTGRVQVSENTLLTKGSSSKETARSVILVPNQKTLYNPSRHDFEVTLADTIHSLPGNHDIDKYARNGSASGSFVFEKATSLKQIFAQLEAVYGIEIIAENENIYNCVFTGDISTQEMLRKLNIVCLTIGASYEVKGTKILVTGKGCQ